MDRMAGQISASHGRLHPAVEPFARHMIEVPGGHHLYVEECGNPAGRPVIVLHGGPGGGCSPYMRRFFDPGHYHVVLFDQRGCGKSRPQASVEANTTQDLISDIVLIRRRLGVEGRWLVFGGSWGATLA
ncbi:MAG: alpha/beta fold hydrolase, partial [Paracoccus sp. (in: a-proteobacteria)]|nr:alpha/beta fold hydrolase [Paracoccus sp. (in: a-proteobacteria)]